MKIEQLVIEGFGPFRDTQKVDFDRYAADGIFLISGRTGTGKSSILDAICFALYGTTPRSADGEKRYRSDYAKDGEPSRVTLDFIVGDEAWRIVRTPAYERPKMRGTGYVTEPASVELFRRDGSEWIGVATKEKEVGSRVIDIVGMNGEQFQQVILLAQGRFAKFLLAKNDDRQKLLRSLFGTVRFEQYEKALEDQRKDAEAGIRDQKIGLTAILDEALRGVEEVRAAASSLDGEDDSSLASVVAADDIAGRIAQAETAQAIALEHLAVATARATEAERVRAEAQKARDEKTALAEKQRRHVAAVAALADLDEKRAEVDAARAELDAARRAETVRTAIAGVTRAENDKNGADAEAERARSEWARARGEAGDPGLPADDADPSVLDAFADDLKRRIGAWEPLRQRESELDRDAQRIEQKRERLITLGEALASLAAREAALPGLIEATRKQRDDAAARAARAEQVDEHIRTLEAQFTAVHEATERASTAAKAEIALAAAKAARDAAEHALTELHRRRLAGYSSELAQQLEAGQPCAVCGSTDHPAPAEPGDDPVTPEAIDEADAARETAVAAHDRAGEARREAELALRDAEARAGGRTATEVDGDLLNARQTKADAEAALRDQGLFDAQIAKLEAERDETSVKHREQASARAQVEADIASAEKSLAEAKADVDEARGPYASVAERIGVAARLASRATARSNAQTEQGRAGSALAAAREALAEALEQARFDSVDAARAAQRDADARASLERVVTDADTRRATAQATLDELSEERIPNEPVELEAVEAALAAAHGIHIAAIEARGEADRLAKSLAGSLKRAHDAHESIREQAEKVAVITRLADTVAGREPNTRRMNLETFVLAAELEQIVDAANVRLSEMSDNRYTLQHSDSLNRRGAASGLGIDVFDAFSGRARAPHTLSGGETFLASLALALGLAEVVTNRAGGIRLDTLFIDEGFGSLDAETLETAMRTLDDLRQGGRTVGLISHVDAMKEQIPAQLRVRRAAGGWSIVEQ
ncbi:nuclease SbcCD subunit C [Microbacterium sorbitolivorans]|uniref:Nuclease SbcCD subunit C n=1 Tax=Microbacterium sorbitolivorans TaxID=1867410 RepID=A0A367XSZ5_9MICO|nr:SMC family ATPase [Microbacterium sorbitolivorans]RCK56737.1 SMC family ATPase [Microbacterium sorbitolivorans]GGF50627.1 nuclease SbcCD subunit C [Microbacterium sorbitolivorans]